MNLDEIRIKSGELLGNIYRLEVAEAIFDAAGDVVTATTVSEETGIKYNRVQEELKRLEAAKVLTSKPAPRGQPVEYKAASTVYWELCKQLLVELRTG